MKIIDFKNLGGYRFFLRFENGETKEVDLKNLISQKVELNALDSARIDKEWGCLEFKDGLVDIEPKTLYKFCNRQGDEKFIQ